ncbi:class I SAM-dependent methyltransferase [Billgrantia tianxiuensis]|uniref:Class I SAM-dependent methyltransferase n=1 Tax=Billgrantia tianxiuensis TaxID=2497861 RepID=A0A6I6SQM0_9GAMM|nr:MULTISPECIES: class I SAM-dependent methyltransferase [Halomonas]MCE8032175.1 class I SAM-dependent methyltransferase [Halomonas sp. MCCC 1A11057]QHC49805.1 class I SAM-dependent methyltransferase [Halomonas tianxiuensis]
MSVVKNILMRSFGRPTGLLGRVGGIIMARMNRRIAQRVIELLDIQPSDRVLEVGFGPGVGIQLLADCVPSGSVSGIDASAEMVKQAKARNAMGVRTGRIELRQHSVEDLPYQPASFDKTLAINSLQTWPDAAAGLREIRRVMRPGGEIALGFTPHSGQVKEGLTEAIVAAGFTDARLVELDEGFCVLATTPGD